MAWRGLGMWQARDAGDAREGQQRADLLRKRGLGASESLCRRLLLALMAQVA